MRRSAGSRSGGIFPSVKPKRGFPMKVTVFLYGSLGKNIPGYRPAQGLEVEFEAGSTISDLLRRFDLKREKLGLVSQNNKPAQDDQPLLEGARIRVFIPVFGG